MSTYTDKDFRDLKKTVEDNNRILKDLKKRANVAATFTFIKWIVIIGVAIGAFTLLQPVAQQFWEAYKSLQSGVSQINEAKQSIPDISITEFISLFRGQ